MRAAATSSVKDASRIVSIGGAVTEILYALGLKDRVVAVDATSLYPDEALKQKPSVGYFRALSAEGVLGLNPSLVLAIDGAGPKETVSRCWRRRPCRSCACRTTTAPTASWKRSG